MAEGTLPKSFIQEMRQELMRMRQEIVGNINHGTSNLASNEGHHLADYEDLAADAADEATTYEILEIERQELKQIDKALDAIESGTYGICEVTGKPIGQDRLRALPYATTTIEAKRTLEQSSEDDDDDDEEEEEE